MDDPKKKAMLLVMEPEGLTSMDGERESDDVDSAAMKCPKCGYSGPREKFQRD